MFKTNTSAFIAVRLLIAVIVSIGLSGCGGGDYVVNTDCHATSTGCAWSGPAQSGPCVTAEGVAIPGNCT